MTLTLNRCSCCCSFQIDVGNTREPRLGRMFVSSKFYSHSSEIGSTESVGHFQQQFHGNNFQRAKLSKNASRTETIHLN
jgi:hypothetical protein